MSRPTAAKNEDLASKLANSPSVQSLLMEQRIGDIVYKLDWDVSQSCYYEDTKEHKIREIDVVGVQLWERTRGKNENYMVTLHVVIECKSTTSYHLVFLPDSSKDYRGESIPFEWLELTDDQRVEQELVASGLTAEQVEEVLDRLRKNKSIVRDSDLAYKLVYLEPPDAPITASAFRETNIDSGKDLDASVLWRARLALSSAISSFQARDDEIDLVNSTAKRFTSGKALNMSNLIDDLTIGSLSINLYHPIVVIDSLMWVVKGSDLEQIEWCRLKQNDRFGGVWWFDVVNTKSFEDYMKLLTKHYRTQLRAARAKRVSEWS